MNILERLLAEIRVGKATVEGVKDRYTRVEIDFAKSDFCAWEAGGKDDFMLPVQGDYIAKASYSGNQGNASMKLNHRHNKELKFSETRKLYSSFNKLYISNRFGKSGVGDTTGKLVLLIGGALSGEIEPAGGGESGLLNIAGANINPATKESVEAVEADVEAVKTGVDVLKTRFVSHSWKFKEQTTQTAAGTAERLFAASKKVKWAIINFETVARIGDSTVTVDAGAHPGQQITAGASMSVEYCDLYDMYIMDAAGVAVIYTITYVEEA